MHRKPGSYKHNCQQNHQHLAFIANLISPLVSTHLKSDHLFTLQVVEGVCSRGLLGGRLGDGFEVGAVALQDGGHEAEEGLLDFHLQGRLLLVPGEVRLDGGHVHCRGFLWGLTD